MATVENKVTLPHEGNRYEHTYGDISPRTQLYAVAKLLTRGREGIYLDRFAVRYPIPKNNSKTITARRYKSLAPAIEPLTEGVAPTAQSADTEDVSTTLNQYGGVLRLTDQVEDLVDDPVLNEYSLLIGEQAADTKEALNWATLKAGVSVFYAGGATSRAAVNSALTKGDLDKVERFFRRNRAATITSVAGASPKIDTHPIGACYVCFAHTDAKQIFEKMNGFIPTEKYASGSPTCAGEIGKVGSFRVILSANYTPEINAGASGTTNLAGNTGDAPTTDAKADVYSCVCMAHNAFGVVPFGGDKAVNMYVHSPGKSSSVDNPLAQRGSVGWKMYDASMILNELWVARIEFAVPATVE